MQSENICYHSIHKCVRNPIINLHGRDTTDQNKKKMCHELSKIEATTGFIRACFKGLLNMTGEEIYERGAYQTE